MISEYRKKTVNGREIEYLDVIHHTTTTKFKFWDRIKILFGKEIRIYSEIYTLNVQCRVVGSEAKTSVERFFPKKSQGMIYMAPDQS